MVKRGLRSSGEEINYGMGVFIRKVPGRDVIRHSGGINGFRSDLVYYPAQDYTIVVLANSESARPSVISNRIAAALFEHQQSTPRE